MKIGITLTSSMHVGQEHIDLTNIIAKKIAQSGHSIVYGGTAYGMMLELADTYKKNGGRELIGIMAKDLMSVTKNYIAYDDLDQSFLLETVSERKDKIISISDGFIILPGGYGTIEELMTIVSGKINKLFDKPIVIINHNGFYNSLILFLDELADKNFSKVDLKDIVFITDDINLALNYFESYKKIEIADKFV